MEYLRKQVDETFAYGDYRGFGFRVFEMGPPSRGVFLAEFAGGACQWQWQQCTHGTPRLSALLSGGTVAEELPRMALEGL